MDSSFDTFGGLGGLGGSGASGSTSKEFGRSEAHSDIGGDIIGGAKGAQIPIIALAAVATAAVLFAGVLLLLLFHRRRL